MSKVHRTPPFFLFLVIVAGLQFSSQVCATGAIVSAAFAESGILTSASVIFAQAVATVAALAIAQFLLLWKQSKIISPWVFGLAGIASIGALIASFASPIWFVFLFVRHLSGALLLSAFWANVRRFTDRDVVSANKKVQLVASSSSVIAIFLGPLFVSFLGIKNIFCIDLLIGLVIFFCYLQLPLMSEQVSAASTHGSESATVNNYSSSLRGVWPILALSFCVWSIGGLFNILEIPILRERFSTNEQELSLIFTLTALANLAAIKALSSGVIEKIGPKLMFLAALSILLFSTMYLNVSKYAFVYPIVILFGAAFGLFQITQSTLVQRISDISARTKGFILLRLSSNMGLLFATILVACSNRFGHQMYHFLSLIGLCMSAALVMNAFLWKSPEHGWRSICILALVSGTLFAPLNAQSNTLRMEAKSIPHTLDPSSVLSTIIGVMNAQVFDTLYEYTATNSLKPVLIDSHVIADDGRTIRFSIKNDKYFSDGSKLLANDIVNSLNSAVRRMGKSSSWAFGDVVGFDDFVQSKSKHLVGLRVLSATQFEVKLIRPFPQFLQILAAPYFGIYKNGPNGKIGTGEYVLTRIMPNHLLLSRRKDISVSPSSPEQIKFVKVSGADQELDLLLKGELDFAQLPENGVNLSEDRFQVVEFEYLQAIALILNTRSKVFSNSIERCSFTNVFLKSFKDRHKAYSSLRSGLPFSWDLLWDSPNTRLLSQNKKNGAIITSKVEVLLSDAIRGFDNKFNEYVNQSLGPKFKASFEPLPADKLIARMKSGAFEAAVIGFVPDYLDQEALITPLVGSGQQYNFAQFADHGVDKLLQISRTISNRQARNSILREIMSSLNSSCPIQFLGSQSHRYITSKKWEIAPASALGIHTIKLRESRFKGIK